MTLVVTGGAGYVGSVCARYLLDAGNDVVVVDDLSTGHRDAVPDGARLVVGDVAEVADEVLGAGSGFGRVDGVVHCAARSLVGESAEKPAKYWHGNVVTTVALLDALRRHDVPRLVFSSSAATYGEPESSPITEDAPTRPTNTYGATKLAVDLAIGNYTAASGGALGAVSLRYFNVAGAHAHGSGGRPAPPRWASGTPSRPTSSPWSSRSPSGSATRSRSTATTGPPPTAPASATTSTSTTSPRPTCSRWTCWPAATPGRSARRTATSCATWATGRASRCSR